MPPSLMIQLYSECISRTSVSIHCIAVLRVRLHQGVGRAEPAAGSEGQLEGEEGQRQQRRHREGREQGPSRSQR